MEIPLQNTCGVVTPCYHGSTTPYTAQCEPSDYF